MQISTFEICALKPSGSQFGIRQIRFAEHLVIEQRAMKIKPGETRPYERILINSYNIASFAIDVDHGSIVSMNSGQSEYHPRILRNQVDLQPTAEPTAPFREFVLQYIYDYHRR